MQSTKRPKKSGKIRFCGPARPYVPLYIHALVQDSDDLHHVRLHAEKHHMRAERDFAASCTDVVGRSTDQGAAAQCFARCLGCPACRSRLAPHPNVWRCSPRCFQGRSGPLATAYSLPYRSGGPFAGDEGVKSNGVAWPDRSPSIRALPRVSTLVSCSPSSCHPARPTPLAEL